MKKLLFIVSISLFMSACVSTQNVAIDTQNAKSFQNKTISETDRNKPSFSALTADKAIFGGIGAAAMISEGNAIVKDNNIDDPSRYISNILASDFAKGNQVKLVPNNTDVLEVESVEKIAKLFPNVDYVMDVRTINWSFGYFPANWKRYRVIYSAKLRLINTQSGTTIAEGFCSRVPEKTDADPAYGELLADEAFLIKSELRIAANQCVDEFRKDVLNLPVTPLETLSLDVKKSNTVPTNNNASSVQTKEVIQSAYPDIVNSLSSNSSLEMRKAAIKVGEEKLYTDEGIVLATIQVLERAVNRTISKKEKYLIDGLAWCAINLGNSKDPRASSVLAAVAESELPKKVKSHAVRASKKLAK